MLPSGFTYQAAFLDRAEEAELLRVLEPMPFEPVRVQGFLLKRGAVHFGMKYDYETGKGELAPMPAFLLPMRARIAAFAGVSEHELIGAAILRYPPGVGIDWHTDNAQFGEVVAGVSLRAACRLWFTQPARKAREPIEQVLEPRSAYVIQGEARWDWEHAIPPVPGLRYSITFRQLGARRPA